MDVLEPEIRDLMLQVGNDVSNSAFVHCIASGLGL